MLRGIEKYRGMRIGVSEMRKALKAAWRYTVPVLAGYMFLGIAFGFLLKTKGFPTWYPILMSAVIYSGALEFAAIPLLSAPFDPLGSFVMGLMISARHLFYGIPLLEKYRNTGKWKNPLIFLLTDETFSIASTIDPPEGIENRYFYGVISVLDYFYWVGGTCLGALFGNVLRFDSTGIDFALTALFIVLFLEQIRTKEGLVSGFLGLGSAAAVLALFGSEKMVVISMVVILCALLLGKRRIRNE